MKKVKYNLKKILLEKENTDLPTTGAVDMFDIEDIMQQIDLTDPQAQEDFKYEMDQFLDFLKRNPDHELYNTPEKLQNAIKMTAMGAQNYYANPEMREMSRGLDAQAQKHGFKNKYDLLHHPAFGGKGMEHALTKQLPQANIEEPEEWSTDETGEA